MNQQEIHINQLLVLCSEGNQTAQLTLYNRYFKAMYNTALRIVKDSYEAEDIMQESFLSAFTKLHTFKGEVSFGAWLKRIVINNSIYHYKKQQKTTNITLDEVLYKVEDNNENDTETNYEWTNMKAQKVLQTINTLKDNYRIALTLHLIEGYDYEEVSNIMQLSYANCRTTISRAKESLRKKLQAETYETE